MLLASLIFLFLEFLFLKLPDEPEDPPDILDITKTWLKKNVPVFGKCWAGDLQKIADLIPED